MHIIIVVHHYIFVTLYILVDQEQKLIITRVTLCVYKSPRSAIEPLCQYLVLNFPFMRDEFVLF